MKHLLTLALLTGCQLFAITAHADPRTEVGETLDAFHKAAAEADEAHYLGLTTPEVVFLGTDGSERWQGQAFRDFVHASFADGQGWVYVPQSRSLLISTDGQTAWFDESLENAILGACRGSGVLVRTGDGWKVAQYNLSVPIPNALVESVVQAIGQHSETLPAATGQDAAGDAAPPVEEKDEKRCPIRHKTVRAANC